MTPSGEASSPNGAANDSTDFAVPLPGDEWEKRDIGPAAAWSQPLQALATAIAVFTYPAAIFWGEELTLLHNEAWRDVSSISGQGENQRGRLPADVWEALRASFEGRSPLQIRSRQLLGTNAETSTTYTVLLSPLFGTASHGIAGVLAQLLPEALASTSHDESEKEPIRQPVKSRLKNLFPALWDFDGAMDRVPLDEHPFFHRFAEMLPTGLAILDDKAHAIFVNQHFYDLTTHRDDDKSFKGWPQSIHEDDYDRVMTEYQEAFRSQTALRTEFRTLGEGNPWRLLLLTPLGDENLQHVSLRDYGGFICSIVDINSEKNAELNERQAAQDAEQRKIQQERFIDMISHEIRNPLSAILHCTEDIEAAIEAPASDVDVESIREAAETINICIAHQRNIVDDVLSFSKLDAAMLSLTPKSCQPSRQIADSLKMFEPEFRKQHMELSYCIDTSYAELAVRWVLADLARIGQILVNLVSNAVKFTSRKQGEKKVTVSMGVSLERPSSYPPNVVFFASDEMAYRIDATNSSEWGHGEPLYILISVKDTGIGISAEGQKRLFERFRQATPKQDNYGGSGLGLNISRKLCQLHGGEIGVASEEGSGSTFGFFFKVKRTDGAGDDTEINEQEMEDAAEVQQQIERHNLASPDEMDESRMPESLENPPVAEVEVSARPGRQLDSRYENTAGIAAQVREAELQPSTEGSHPTAPVQAHEDEALSRPTNALRKDTAPESVARQAAKPPASRNVHILLAEDNIVNQRIVLRKLEKQGFSVTAANNGQEAVDGIRDAPRQSTGGREAFDIVLMDQEMPVLDGNGATKELRRLEKDGVIDHIPILGVTANVRADQQKDMIASGMDEVISKPYKIDELIQRIQQLLPAKQDAKAGDAKG